MGKISKLKEQNPIFAGPIDRAARKLPPKYINWFVSSIKRYPRGEKELIQIAQDFDDALSTKSLDRYIKQKELPHYIKDIGWWTKEKVLIKNKEYESVPCMRHVVNEAIKSKSIREQKQNVDVLYDDGRFLLIAPKDFKAVAKYGSDTEWCITEEDTFREYVSQTVCFLFFIDRNIFPVRSIYTKIAICKWNPYRCEFYLSDDDSLSKIDFSNLLPKTIKPIIMKKIQTYFEPITPEDDGAPWVGDRVSYKEHFVSQIVDIYKVYLLCKDLNVNFNSFKNNELLSKLLLEKDFCVKPSLLREALLNVSFICNKKNELSFRGGTGDAELNRLIKSIIRHRKKRTLFKVVEKGERKIPRSGHILWNYYF